MEHVFLKARAKINISLDVLGKRADGYHEMKTVMQTLAFCDGILIKKVYKPNYLKITSNLEWLPTDSRNLAYRAAKHLIDMYGIKSGVFIELRKNIPVSAGLAGGSTDCAAVLVGMRNLFGLPLTNESIIEMGKIFGADVPFCVMRGTALAEGIGERLTNLPCIPPAYVLLAKPPFSVSTAEVFRSFNAEKVRRRPDTEKIIFYLHRQDIAAVCSEFCNVLESVAAVKYPVINMLKAAMLENGALGSLMSGSGPTVFGFYRTKQEVFGAYKAIKNSFPLVKDIYITKTFPLK